MTFNELLTETELLYESLNSSDAPGFTQEEWGQLFTIAQRKVVLKILQEGVEKNALNQLAIEKLIQEDSYLVFTTNLHFKNADGSPAKQLDAVLNPKFFWILDEYVATAIYPMIPVRRITYDFYRRNLSNPFRKPDPVEGFWMFQQSLVVPTDVAATGTVPIFITDLVTSVITGYYVVGVFHPDNYPIVSGIVYPTGGTQASCLNPSVHPRIVEEAVTLARMSVVDQAGYQLAVTEFNK